MKKITINLSEVKTEAEFHNAFRGPMGFPDFYGNNMNAWIDCMGSLDDEAPMTSFSIGENESLVLEIVGAEQFKKNSPEMYLEFLECTAWVNAGRIEGGYSPTLIISFPSTPGK